MSDFLDRTAAALLDASLAATAIAGFVVLAMIQSRQPARRRDWARAGLLATLALLPLSGLNPVPRFDLRGPLRSILATNLDDPSPRPPGQGRNGRTSPFDKPEVGEGVEGPGCRGEVPGWPRSLARGMVVAYLAGASTGLGWIALGLAGSAWLVRRGRAPSPRALAGYRALPYDGPGGRPKLLILDRATRPVLVAGIRPAILIPPDLDEPESADRLRLSLLHELAHAENRDHWFSTAATLAQALWFFLPPVWWIRDQLKLDQEFLADRRAVDHFGTSGGYASSLVDLADPGRVVGEAPNPSAIRDRPAAVESGVASALFQRVVMLLKCPFAIEGRAPRWWRWSTAGTLALATLAASCLTLRGLADWSNPPPPIADEAPRSIRFPDLAVGQRGDDGRPFDLRYRLPEQFRLTFEVMAEPADLAEIVILGHRLGIAPDGAGVGDDDPSRSSFRLWHQVRIIRNGGLESVEVDGKSIPPENGPARLAPWLTIRPAPGQTTRIRDLELAW